MAYIVLRCSQPIAAYVIQIQTVAYEAQCTKIQSASGFRIGCQLTSLSAKTGLDVRLSSIG